MFQRVYQGKTVLVTGHTGFKGSWLSVWLQKLGAAVYGFSDRIPTNPSHFECLYDGMIDHVEADICDQHEIIKRVISVKPDFIFHLAAQAIVSDSMANPVGTIERAYSVHPSFALE